MLERAKGPRLYWHKSRGKWVIRDTGRPETATGTADRTEAEKRLAEYIAGRDRPAGPRDTDQVLIADVLDNYGNEHGVTVKDPVRIGCAKDDEFRTGFAATAPNGERVTGVVCSGWMKGATLRLD